MIYLYTFHFVDFTVLLYVRTFQLCKNKRAKALILAPSFILNECFFFYS